MEFDKDSLQTVLADAGYDIKVMSPQWCDFAIQIIIAGTLQEIEAKLNA